MQAGFFLFIFFISPKTDEATFLFDQNIMGHHVFWFWHLKKRGGHFFQVWKKTDEGHLKQMRDYEFR